MSRLRTDYLTVPLSGRLSDSDALQSEIVRLHDLAVKSGNPNYKDPQSGLTVMTAEFLALQKLCCSSGCRHCPFEVE